MIGNWQEKDILVFEQWLTELLSSEIVTVTFEKKDGTIRNMRCTRNSALIPAAPVTESKRTKAATPGVLPVYDVEAAGWRSFTITSIKAISFSLE